MKILNLKIIDKNDNIIRNIDFKENGISYIYGDIKEPKDKRGTSNSLGKTLLLGLINYIYGANEDSSVSKKELEGYRLDAIIKIEGREESVSRIIGASKKIKVGSKVMTLGEYKEWLNIDRNIYRKQIVLNKKASIISASSNPNIQDNISFIYLLNLNKIIKYVKNIYESQDRIKSLKANKNELICFYQDVDIDKIDEEIYFVDKEVNKLKNEIDDVANKIKNIELAGLQENMVEEYSVKSAQLKKVRASLQRLKIEGERLAKFIEDSDKVDITSEHIIAIYNKVKIEVPELIKRELHDVENFHKKVYDERKEYLGNKKNEIEKKVNNKEKEILKLSAELDRLGKILADNKVYQECVMLYENFNNKLQDLIFKQGKLSQIKNVDNKICSEDDNLTENFDKANQQIKEYSVLLEEYREYIYNITNNIYNEDINSYFDIKIRKKNQRNRPLNIEFNIKGDTGEGVSEVKKNIVDYLIFSYNNVMEFLIQDSACYNGIDPRQVTGLLKNLEESSLKINKQAIISINRYQLGGDEEFIKVVKKNSSIVLSEKEKLLRFDF